MREKPSESKPDKPIGDKLETPAAQENGDKAERQDRPEIDTAKQRQERIADISVKRERELTELNAARARLGLTPTDTSVAITALDGERTVLDRGERGRGDDKQADNETTREITQLIPQIDAETTITPEVRYYFQKLLGASETMRRLRDMDAPLETKIREYKLYGQQKALEAAEQARAKLVPELRDLIRVGNLNSLVARFTEYDPELRQKAQAADAKWHAEQSRLLREEQNMSRTDPRWGRAFVSTAQPSREMFFRKSFDDIERSLAAVSNLRSKNQAGRFTEGRRTDETEPLSERERAIREKIAEIPDEFERLKRVLSMSPETRKLVASDEKLLQATEADLRAWNDVLASVFGS